MIDTIVVKMNPQIKADWVAALRSKEFVQGTSGLRNDQNQYCCLGVLCELHRRQTGAGAWKIHADGQYWYTADEFELAKYYPLQRVVEWAGILNNNPHVDFENTLAGLNDSGNSFEQIASLIEANL